MNPLMIASLVASGAKGIGSLIQGIGGQQRQNQLWRDRPLLGVTEGEKQNDALYRQMASITEMPGQKRAEERMDEAMAEGVYEAQKGGISSLGTTQSAVDLASKKISAIRDLAGLFSEYKAQRMESLGAWNRQKTELEQQRFQLNEYEPWNIKMNEAVSRKQAGLGGAGSAIDTGLGILGDYAGTQNYLKMLELIYGNKQGVSNPNIAPMPTNYKQQFDPLANYRGLIKPRT